MQIAADLELPLRLDWFLPLPSDGALASAVRHDERVEQLALRLVAPERPAADLFAEVTTGPDLRTALPVVLGGVEETVQLLAPPVRAVGAGGAAAGLALVGAWAGLRVRRRETELRALLARGLSPLRAAGGALAEAAAPATSGAAAGLAVGVLLVRVLGPTDLVPLDGRPVLWAAAALLAVVGVVTGVTAAAVVRLGQVGVGAAQQVLSRIPLVPVLLAVTVVAALPLLREPDAGQQGVQLVTLVVPLLVVVAGSAAAVGGLQRLAPRLRRPVDQLPLGALLAVRRVLAAPGATRLVIVSVALALGLVVFAGALGASTDRTVAVKAVVAAGSDVVIDLDNRQVAPGAPDGATVVRRDRDVSLLPGEAPASLLAVDPARFEAVAFWDDALAEDSLASLMDALRGHDGPRVPVLIAGGPPTRATATGGQLTVDSLKFQVPVQVVGTARAWPGMSSTRPLVIAAQDDLAAALRAQDRAIESVTTAQLWSRGTAEQLLAALPAAGIAQPEEGRVSTAAAFRESPALRAQGWTLDYLQAVAAAAGLLAVVALGLHAAAQQRRRAVATVLLSRMGLTRRSARTSVAVELMVLGGLAALFAVVFTLPAARLLMGRVDPVPDLLPGPLFAVPATALLALVVGVTLAAAAGAAAVDALARRIPGGEVLRGDD